MILALDVAYSTGWARGGVSHGSPVSGTLKLPENFDRALKSLREWVHMEVTANKVETVVIEHPLMRVDRGHGADALYVLICLQAVAREAAVCAGAVPRLAPIDKWRKVFIGQSNMTRVEAKLAAFTRCRQLGWIVATNDEAEACGIWYWHMAEKYRMWMPKRRVVGAL